MYYAVPIQEIASKKAKAGVDRIQNQAVWWNMGNTYCSM